MSGAVCPSCGVAVVPGYVRCPKCHKPLPRRPSTVAEGGTALNRPRKFPVVAVIAAAALGAGLIIFLGLRSGTDGATEPNPTMLTDEADTAEVPPTTGPDDEATEAPTPPNADSVADALKKALTKEKLWSTVTVIGERVEVRSGSCADPAMGPLLDASAPWFKAVGLTKLRCVEQSGQLVSERGL